MKIEVLKELPGCKVGERFELCEGALRIETEYGGHYWTPKYIELMAKHSWIKFIDEKKTLKEKLKYLVSDGSMNEIIEIFRQHFLASISDGQDHEFMPLGVIRKAIREVE